MEKEAKEALLAGITKLAEQPVSAQELERLATAYAMTVGASKNHLPGHASSSS
ncbi:MAG: hypothetical protein K0U84_21710 [Actinomycetia bacterium]|nr:hypothetical protein [Actinomycetes bacterium]